MKPGWRYASGIVFVRHLASFDDAVFEHERGAKLCLHLGHDPVGRILNFFFVPEERHRAIFDRISKENIGFFVAGIPHPEWKAGPVLNLTK